MSNKVVITYSTCIFLSWIKNMYILIFQNKMFLLPRPYPIFFPARNRKQTIFLFGPRYACD